MPINNSVFCNQIPLPWEKENLFMDSAGRVCIILGFPRSDATKDCLCTKGHIYMLLIFPRCSAMTQTVIKGKCPGTVMLPLNIYCRIPSFGYFLIKLTVGEAFLVTTKLQQWFMVFGRVCMASLSFGEPGVSSHCFWTPWNAFIIAFSFLSGMDI